MQLNLAIHPLPKKTELGSYVQQRKGKRDQLVLKPTAPAPDELTIALDSGRKFKKPKLELSVSLLGSALNFVTSVDIEKCLEKPLKLVNVVFWASIISFLWTRLIYLFNLICPSKATYISQCIDYPVNAITTYIPNSLQKIKIFLISVYLDTCTTIASGSLIWIFVFWWFLPSTEGSFQVRFRNSILVHLVAFAIVHSAKAIRHGFFKLEDILVTLWFKMTNYTPREEPAGVSASQGNESTQIVVHTQS